MGSIPHKLITFALNHYIELTPTLLSWFVICTPTSPSSYLKSWRLAVLGSQEVAQNALLCQSQLSVSVSLFWWPSTAFHLCHAQAKAAVKRKVDESEEAARSDISNLEVQGCFWHQGCEGGVVLDYWSKAVWALPSHIMSFALNAAQDTLATSQFQPCALEVESFSAVPTVWATANLASCPQYMSCGPQREAL